MRPTPPSPDNLMTSLPDPPNPSSLPESIRLLQLLWRFRAALERTSTEMESQLGVNGQQRFLLRFIGLAPGSTQRALADMLSIDVSDIQRDLEQLVAKHLLVEQGPSSAYYLTAAGAGVNAAMAGTVEDAVSKAADDASAHERTFFRRMLERIVDRLNHQSHHRS